MTILEQKFHGPVQMLRTELANWDAALQQWQPARRTTVARYLHGGQISEYEDALQSGPTARFVHRYDESGRLLESAFYQNDAPVSKTVRRYDEAGRLAHVIESDRDGGERESERYDYDGGRKTRLRFVPKLDLPAESGISFGVEGAEMGYGAEGVVTIETRYDDLGQPCEALFRNKDHAVVLRVVLTRDDAQRLVKEESFAGEQNPFSLARAIEYFPPDEIAGAEKALSQFFGSHRPICTTTYRYDAAGRQVEKRTVIRGLSEEVAAREFDDHHNLICEITERTAHSMELDASGQFQPGNSESVKSECRYDYRYDSFGNWTERIVSMRLDATADFQPSNIVRREILYFSNPHDS
jgi:hypothetical protein